MAIGADKTVKIVVTAETRPFVKGVTDASTATKKLATDAASAGDKSAGAMAKMGTGAGQAAAALRKLETAQGSLRVAELRLNDLRSKGVGGTRLAAAEEAVERARRGVTSATEAHTRALKADAAAADKAAVKNKGLSDSLKGMKVAAAGIVGAGLVTFMRDALAAAGDLQQSMGGVDAVFKSSADEIHAFGENSAEAVGLSTNEFNELITVTGAMLKNKGLTDFTQKSLDLVKVGADLAAQFGGSTAEAVGALNAAMRGESDPIERYGISLNEAAVNAELAAQGLANLEGAALDQAKATARIELITRQAGDAMGAFAREADTLQGQQQRLNAEWENAKATLGQALLPALTDVMSMLRGGVDATVAAAAAFEAIPGPVKTAVGALIALHLLKGPLGGFLAGTITQVKTLAATLKGGGIAGGAKAAGSALMGAFGGPLGIAVGIGAAALTFWWQEAQKTEQVAETLRGTIDKTTGAFTKQSKVAIADALLGDLSTEDIQLVESLGFNIEDLAAAALAGGPAFDEMRKKIFAASEQAYVSNGLFDDSGQALEGLGRSFVRAGDAAERAKVVGEVADKIEGTGDAAATATPSLKGYEDIVGEIHTQAEEAAQAQKDLAKAILDVAGAAMSADEAAIALEEAIASANAAVTENGRTLDIATEAGRKNKAELIGLAEAALQMAEANLENGDSVKSVKSAMADAREEFVRVAQKMGLSKKAAEDLADEYGLTKGKVDNLKDSMGDIPKEVVSKLKVETSEATRRLNTFKMLYDSIGNKQVTLSAVVQSSGFAEAQKFRNRFASGGFVSGPGTSTSDSIPARLSDGEYVLKAAAVAKYGRHVLDEMNAMRFAQGGYVTRVTQTAAAAIDYDRLTASMRGAGLTVNVSGGDPHRAARHVVDEWQWRVGR